MPSADLRCGKMCSKIILGEPILFTRDAAGKVAAIRDLCPHRAMPLSFGHFDGREITCCYHGWQFAPSGQCTKIPSLLGHEGVLAEKICVRSYMLREQQGSIWIYMADAAQAPPPQIAEPPQLPGIGNKAPNVRVTLRFPQHIDDAALGLLDPLHAPYIHASPLWRQAKSMHAKTKAFGPTDFGICMRRHAPSKNSFGYKLLGGKPETEISFLLPVTRLEHIAIGRHHVVNLTTITPADDGEIEITNCLWWTQGWLAPLTPFVQRFAENFLLQDQKAAIMQRQGLRHERAMLLIKDADTQARWYFQLRSEYERCIEEARAFKNPVPECQLRWRS